MSTKTKNIHKGVAAAPKADSKKATLRMAKAIVEKEDPVALKVAKAVGSSIKSAATTVNANKGKITKKTTEVVWGATWRTGIAGISVPYALSFLDAWATPYHNAIAKGVQYTGTFKEAWARTLDTVYPVTDTLANHPVIATVAVAALWVLNKFVKAEEPESKAAKNTA